MTSVICWFHNSKQQWDNLDKQSPIRTSIVNCWQCARRPASPHAVPLVLPAVVANWLGLAACVVTSDVCVEERQMLEQDRDLLLQVSALAGGELGDMCANAPLPPLWGCNRCHAAHASRAAPDVCFNPHCPACAHPCTAAAASEWLAQADPGSLPVWQWVVTDASLVLCSSCLLSRSLVLLAELDCSLVDHSSGELGGLVLTALQSLQAAMDEATAGGPSAPADAVRALQLAAFAADGLVAVGTAAGLAPVPQDGEPAHAPVHAALQLLTEAELADLQLCLLLHTHSLAPALLAAVGAALQHGVLSPTAGNAHCQRRLKLAFHRAGLFLPWLGVAGVQLPKPVLAQCSEAVSSTALAAWLPAALLHLQLHAARDTTFLPGVHLGAFRRGLAEACRGLASKHWETSGLSQHRALAQQRGQQAAGASSSTAGTAGGATAARDAAEELPALHQLATAVCILSHWRLRRSWSSRTRMRPACASCSAWVRASQSRPQLWISSTQLCEASNARWTVPSACLQSEMAAAPQPAHRQWTGELRRAGKRPFCVCSQLKLAATACRACRSLHDVHATLSPLSGRRRAVACSH